MTKAGMKKCWRFSPFKVKLDDSDLLNLKQYFFERSLLGKSRLFEDNEIHEAERTSSNKIDNDETFQAKEVL